MIMNLESLGWSEYITKASVPNDIPKDAIARIGTENKGGYVLYAEQGELEGILPGKMLREKKHPSEFPKVGDWVVFQRVPQENKGVIQSILPRASKLSRTSVAKDRSAENATTEQIIVTNIDIAFIVQGLDDDFNPRRIGRYIAMAEAGGCAPVIILNKTDMAEDLEQKISEVKAIVLDYPVFPISAFHGTGMTELKQTILPGMTIVFVGSSGAGKSTLVNSLIGAEIQKTQPVRADDGKGRHTTTRREMIFLPNGAILIDTPGMREVGVWIDKDSASEFPTKKTITRTKKKLRKNFHPEDEDFI